MRKKIWLSILPLVFCILALFGTKPVEAKWVLVSQFSENSWIDYPNYQYCMTQYGILYGPICTHEEDYGSYKEWWVNVYANCTGWSASCLGGCTPDPWPLSNTLFTEAYAFYIWEEEEDDCCPEEEKDCCKNDQCKNPTEGNPITVLTGNNKEKETDLEFTTAFEKGFHLSRRYDSRFQVDSPLGFGWTHNYNVVLKKFCPANAIVIIDETNHVRAFKKDPENDGIYTSKSPRIGYISVNQDGTRTWYRGNGIRYTFDAQNKFIAKTDGAGNVQTLSYDTDGRLETVTDEATGRGIGFVYNADDKIDHITGPVTDAVPDGIWVSYQYDAQGNLTRVEYADDNNGSTASGFDYRYEDTNDVHNLTAKYNLKGDFLSSWEYDGQDRAWKNTTRDGKGVTLYYDTNYVRVTDAQGVQKYYYFEVIDGKRKVTSITGGAGCTSCGNDAVRYAYDEKRRVIEKELASGRIDQYTDFDDKDRYLTEIQAVGTENQRTFHYTLHPDTGQRLSIVETSLLGTGDKETVFDYDDDGNGVPNENPTRLMHRRIERGYTQDETGTLSAYEHITTYAFDAKGNIIEIDGPLPGDQDKITYTYDPATGDRLTETRPLVGATSYQYDAAGNLTQVTDINGQVATFTYDGRNRQLSATRDGITTSRSYTAAGEVDAATDALGRTLDYTYNSAGFTEKIIDPAGDYLFYGYDANGRQIEQSIFSATNTRTHFKGTDFGDPANTPGLTAGKPWKSLHYSADGSTVLETTYGYDAAGNLASVTDANNNHTGYQYDAFNRLKQVDQPGDTTTTYAYDRHGNLASVTDAEGHVTTYTYDDLGRLVRTDSPDTGATRYSYDAAGNLRFKVQNGNTVEYQYDALNRLTHIIYADPSQNVTLTYDTGAGSNLTGRLASVTDAAGTTQYSYDIEGRLAMETRTVSGIAYVTGYSYDNAGNLRTITYPTGQTVSFDPDTTDPAKIAAVRLNPATTNQTLAANIAYQPFGPMSSLMLGNSVSVTKTYDLNYQLADMLHANGSTVMDRTYTPDNVGNITAITDNLDANRSQSFGYDPLYRLTSATGVYGSIAYTYDNVGNRLSRTRTGAAPSNDAYTYYPGTNRLHIVQGTHAELIAYDADGNTNTRTPGATNPTPAVTDPADYLYNTSGQRIRKTNSAPKVFHYDQTGQLIAETTPAGDMLKAYIWLHGQPLAMLTPDGSIYYYHNDHLGTPQRLTDQSANVVWAADYLPFGKADVRVGGVENNLRFSGQYFDNETGLHYNYHRYYDPGVGRYLRADPLNISSLVNDDYIIEHLKSDFKPNRYFKPSAEEIELKSIFFKRYIIGKYIGHLSRQNDYTYALNNPLINADKFGLYSNCQLQSMGAVACSAAAIATCMGGPVTAPACWGLSLVCIVEWAEAKKACECEGKSWG